MRVLPLIALVPVVACAPASPDLEADLRAIEALNQHDIDAVMSSDVDALISQWTDDFVLIGAGASCVTAMLTPSSWSPRDRWPVVSNLWSTYWTSRKLSSLATMRSSGAPSVQCPGLAPTEKSS